MDTVNLTAKFEVRSFTCSWDNRAYLKTLGSPWLRPRYFFSKFFNGHLFGWTLWMYRPNLKSVALPVPEIIASTSKTLCSPWICRSRSPKVTDFGTNWKRVYVFLLVRSSNLGPILHRFGDIAGFLRSRVTPPLFRRNFGGVPVAPNGPCWVQPGIRGLKLFGREIIFEEFQPMWLRYLNVTHGQTEGRTRTDNIRSQYRALH